MKSIRERQPQEVEEPREVDDTNLLSGDGKEQVGIDGRMGKGKRSDVEARRA